MTTVILTEKSSQAQFVSAGLGFSGMSGRYKGTYYKIVNASGHLLEYEDPESAKEGASWSDPASLLPLPRRPKLVPISDQKAKLERARQALSQATEVIIATDPDREGEAIGRNILKFCGYNGGIKRLMLTKGTDPAAVQRQFSKLFDEPDMRGMYYAQQARSLLDYLYIYITRAFTAYGRRGGMGEHLGQGKGPASVVSLGRVQTPTVRLVVERDRAIKNFVPVNHYKVKLQIAQGNLVCDLDYYPVVAAEMLGENRRGVEWQYPANRKSDSKPKPLFLDKQAVDDFAARLKGLGRTDIIVQAKDGTKKPPHCLSMNDLQQLASKLFSISPDGTLKAAQKLYTDGYLSYPRTKERQLSVGVYDDAPETLRKLSAYGFAPAQAAHDHIAEPETKRPAVYSGKDMVHDGLFPTLKVPEQPLKGNEAKVYDLVVKRYIQAHLPAAQSKIMAIQAKPPVEGLIEDRPARFAARGESITFMGWLSAFPELSPKIGNPLPELQSGPVDIANVPVSSAKTEAPKPFTTATLLAAMENAGRFLEGDDAAILKKVEGLGTDATRHEVLKVIEARVYLSFKKKVTSTPKGRDLIEHTPNEISNIELTAEWETKLSEIAETRGDDGLPVLREFLKSQIIRLETVIQNLVDQIGELPESSRGGTNGPTEKMTDLAQRIMTTLGVKPDNDITSSFDNCKAFINAHIEDYKAKGSSNNPPTPKMLNYAKKLAKDCKVKLPDEAAGSFDACRTFINQYKSAKPPSESMLGLAEKIAGEKSLTLPDDARKSFDGCKAFLDKHASRKSA